VSLPQLLSSSQTSKNVAAEINLPQLFFLPQKFYCFNGKIQSPYTSRLGQHIATAGN
jgi:hypothetical protein